VKKANLPCELSCGRDAQGAERCFWHFAFFFACPAKNNEAKAEPGAARRREAPSRPVFYLEKVLEYFFRF